jgi:hypothetical protein
MPPARPSQSMAAIAVPLLVPCSMKRPVKSSAAEERARIPKVSYLMLSEDIVRTLSVAFAKRLAAPVFLRLFREHPLFRTDASAYEEYARGLLLGASYRQFGGQQTCGCAWPARRSRATLYWHRAGGRCW